jgi:hypothetical protein
MGPIISSVAHERSWRVFQLLQQWPDMRSVINLLIRQVKSDDFITIGVDADMTLLSDAELLLDHGRYAPGQHSPFWTLSS